MEEAFISIVRLTAGNGPAGWLLDVSLDGQGSVMCKLAFVRKRSKVMSTLPPTTRRFLARLQTQPQVHQRVMTHLYEVHSLLVHGIADHPLHKHRGTDWHRLRELGQVLHYEAARVRIGEAVALFAQLLAMADAALAVGEVDESMQWQSAA